mgnify:CR=1 FL=1
MAGQGTCFGVGAAGRGWRLPAAGVPPASPTRELLLRAVDAAIAVCEGGGAVSWWWRAVHAGGRDGDMQHLQAASPRAPCNACSALLRASSQLEGLPPKEWLQFARSVFVNAARSAGATTMLLSGGQAAALLEACGPMLATDDLVGCTGCKCCAVL